MAGLPVVSGRQAIAALVKVGFARIRQRGSHVVLQKAVSGGTRTVVIPDHRELARGTLRSILRKAGLAPEEFSTLLSHRGFIRAMIGSAHISAPPRRASGAPRAA